MKRGEDKGVPRNGESGIPGSALSSLSVLLLLGLGELGGRGQEHEGNWGTWTNSAWCKTQGKQVAKSGQTSGHFDIDDLLSQVSSYWASWPPVWMLFCKWKDEDWIDEDWMLRGQRESGCSIQGCIMTSKPGYFCCHGTIPPQDELKILFYYCIDVQIYWYYILKHFIQTKASFSLLLILKESKDFSCGTMERNPPTGAENRLNPWSRKIPHAWGQLSLCATTAELVL